VSAAKQLIEAVAVTGGIENTPSTVATIIGPHVKSCSVRMKDWATPSKVWPTLEDGGRTSPTMGPRFWVAKSAQVRRELDPRVIGHELANGVDDDSRHVDLLAATDSRGVAVRKIWARGRSG
jgi:hypothetical protein